MKCFLHIGTEKTATTTIQSFFDRNRGELLKQGIIYTSKAGKLNNWALPLAAYNTERRDDVTKRHGLYEDCDLRAFQNNVIQNLTKEIHGLVKKRVSQSKENTIVFSSEHIQSRLTEIDELERLKEIIYSFGVTDVSVVVYLRRPADIASSLYSTTIKAGKILSSPPKPPHPYWNNVCDHQNTIKKFASVFGEASVVPKLFDKKEFKDGCILSDLINVMGIPANTSYSFPKDANQSLSSLGVSLLARLNSTIPAFIDNKPNPIRADLVRYVEKHFSNSRYIMPSHLYEEYDAAFEESNDWVRRTFFPHRNSLFSSVIPQEAAISKPSDLDLEVIAGFIADVWNDKQKRIFHLNKSKRRGWLLGW